MKKYLLVTLAILLLLGGVVNAQDGIVEDQIILTTVVNELPEELPKADGVYLLIIDGLGSTEYNIGFYIETSSESPSAIDVCLKGPDGMSVGTLPVTIQGDYANGTYTVSSCNQEDPQLSVDLLILTDTDGDGLVDGEDSCPESDLSETVDIEGCYSGVANTLFENGCTISDHIAICAKEVANHGEFVSCVTHYTNGLKPSVLSGAEKGAIQSCAAQSSIGILPCSEPGCEEGDPSLVQNRHRARYELAENDLVIPCVEIGQGQYLAVNMDLVYASSMNFHFKMKKADIVPQQEIEGIDDLEGTCAHYDVLSNSLIFPRLAIGDNEWRVQLKLLGANSANFHFKLQSIAEVAE